MENQPGTRQASVELLEKGKEKKQSKNQNLWFEIRGKIEIRGIRYS